MARQNKSPRFVSGPPLQLATLAFGPEQNNLELLRNQIIETMLHERQNYSIGYTFMLKNFGPAVALHVAAAFLAANQKAIPVAFREPAWMRGSTILTEELIHPTEFIAVLLCFQMTRSKIPVKRLAA